MSAKLNTPLIVISNGDGIKYEDDPTVTQAKVNLMAVEHVQQERAEQRGWREWSGGYEWRQSS